MKPLPDTDLASLVTSAATGLLFERRQDLESKVRTILKRQEIIAEDVVRFRGELKKRETKLEALAKKITRLKAGEWEVLAELEKDMKEQKPGQKPESEEEAVA